MRKIAVAFFIFVFGVLTTASAENLSCKAMDNPIVVTNLDNGVTLIVSASQPWDDEIQKMVDGITSGKWQFSPSTKEIKINQATCNKGSYVVLTEFSMDKSPEKSFIPMHTLASK